ncbi:MAG TPA: peroxiredoxin-like family protein [Cyclobacteriaceae bacterium]|nr:peroxiredoxin-like family protein [Cyclobacteriaceae bacterium]
METKTNVAVPSWDEQVHALKEQMKNAAPAEILSVFSKEAEDLGLSDVAKNALKPGRVAPAFELPNATGNLISLVDALRKGNIVLTFYRGLWCPYCNLQLKLYQEILPQIRELNANLIAISPNTPDHSLSMKEKHDLGYEVLSDFDNHVAKQYKIVFTQADHVAEVGKKLGADISAFNGTDKNEIPVPATFIIDKDGIIRFTFAHGDYTKRIEPQQVLDVLSRLNSK